MSCPRCGRDGINFDAFVFILFTWKGFEIIYWGFSQIGEHINISWAN